MNRAKATVRYTRHKRRMKGAHREQNRTFIGVPADLARTLSPEEVADIAERNGWAVKP